MVRVMMYLWYEVLMELLYRRPIFYNLGCKTGITRGYFPGELDVQCHHAKWNLFVTGPQWFHLLESSMCCGDNDRPHFQSTYTISTKLRSNTHISTQLNPLSAFTHIQFCCGTWFTMSFLPFGPKNTVPTRTQWSRQKQCQRWRWFHLLEGFILWRVCLV